MPHHEHIKVEGRISDVFFHRFVIELSTGKKILADLGPKGVDAFALETGIEIIAEGEMKPSELKVEKIARKGQTILTIEHKKKHGPHEHGPHDHGPHGHHHHERAEPGEAKQAVKRAGLEPIGEPRRKPKHFEVLGRRGTSLFECHMEFDGHIRKEKPVDPSDDKWSSELKRAA